MLVLTVLFKLLDSDSDRSGKAYGWTLGMYVCVMVLYAGYLAYTEVSNEWRVATHAAVALVVVAVAGFTAHAQWRTSAWYSGLMVGTALMFVGYGGMVATDGKMALQMVAALVIIAGATIAVAGFFMGVHNSSANWNHPVSA